MKRDMMLCRHILLQIEAHPEPRNAPLELPEEDTATIAYHLEKLKEAGLIHATNTSTETSFAYTAHRLTNAGHDLLELGRSETLWRNAIDALTQSAGAITFPLMHQQLAAYADFRLQ